MGGWLLDHAQPMACGTCGETPEALFHPKHTYAPTLLKKSLLGKLCNSWMLLAPGNAEMKV